MPVEAVRAAIEAGLERAHVTAEALGGPDPLIVAEGLVFVVRNAAITTVVPATGAPAQLAALLDHGRA